MSTPFHDWDPWDFLLELADGLAQAHEYNLQLTQELERQRDQLATLYLVVDQIKKRVDSINTKKES
jgi:hypothetical protein